jgi:hypothetical protein
VVRVRAPFRDSDSFSVVATSATATGAKTVRPEAVRVLERASEANS